MESDHCLAYPMEKEEMEEDYEAGVLQKVTILAEAASCIGNNEYQTEDDSIDESRRQLRRNSA